MKQISLFNPIMLLAMLLLSPVTAMGYDFEADGIYYNIENRQAVVTSNESSSYYSGDVVIPESVTHEGVTYPVTIIGAYAFNNCTDLASVTLPASILSIGPYSLSHCTGLTSMTIPEGVTHIDPKALEGCTGIKDLYFNAVNCTSPSMYQVFKDCPLESIVFGDRVQVVPEYLAYRQAQLKHVTFSNSVTSIGGLAFERCTSLTDVILPESLISIGGSAFSDCKSLTSLVIPDAVTTIQSYAFSGCSGLEYIVMGNSVTDIGVCAFKGCTGLTNLVLSNSVSYIGDYAFEQCAKLDSVTLGCGVNSIGNTIFHSCPQLVKVTCLSVRPPAFNDSGLLDGLGDYARATLHVLPETVAAYQAAMYWKDFSQIVGDATIDSSEVTDGYGYDFKVDGIYYNVVEDQAIVTHNGYPNSYMGDIVIPAQVAHDGVTYPVVAIGDNAFSTCVNVTSITLPATVTTIGGNAFSSCKGLTEITLPEGLTSIGSYAFSICSGLKQITLPNSLTSIGSFAFYACDGLTSITIPESVTVIHDYAFSWCSHLETVFFNAVDCQHTGVYALFGECPSIVFGEHVQRIPKVIAKGNTKLTSVTIPNSVTSIGNDAFAECEKKYRVWSLVTR